jgi:hypothetical protein
MKNINIVLIQFLPQSMPPCQADFSVWDFSVRQGAKLYWATIG